MMAGSEGLLVSLDLQYLHSGSLRLAALQFSGLEFLM